MSDLYFEGRLKASPFQGELFNSSFRQLELVTESDFIAYHELARSRWAPVWMSFSQKSRFMTAVYQHLVETVWDDVDRMIMVARVPSVRMPLELGQEKILQVVELAPEVQRLDALGESFLSLYDGFVRHPLESGNNELRLQWHRPRGEHAARKFEDLTQRLRAMGLDASVAGT
jgi:hypothetical protein